ncbi:hypothetical protein JKP88DRAFT_262742 [Tribonema minus]|uniref:Uncharacterized protein n=1 Tax=Tribonema minus TaxID=303371 RepID=A0A836CGQ8_9STRA|nr:hypothetical protein JKP88DRAFT_262742 [Tribonema minus]
MALRRLCLPLILLTLAAASAFVCGPVRTRGSEPQLRAAKDSEDRSIFQKFGDWQRAQVKRNAEADPRRAKWIEDMMRIEGVTREVAEREVTLYTIDPLGYMIKKRKAQSDAAKQTGNDKKK